MVISQNFQLGRVSTKLGIEDRILKDGILPKKQLIERSEFLMGVVEGLVEGRQWEKALKLVLDDPIGKVLYSGKIDELCDRVIADLTPSDFKYIERDMEGDSSVTNAGVLKILSKLGKHDSVYNLALQEAMDPNSSFEILHISKIGVGEPKFSSGIKIVAERFIKTNPDRAYELFDQISERQGILDLYNYLDLNFSLKNLHLMDRILNSSKFAFGSVSKPRFKSLVKKALSSEDRESEGIGKYLFDMVADHGIKLDESEIKELERLAGRDIRLYEIDQNGKKYDRIALNWAISHWEREPIAAYKIFKRKKYDGEEVLPCARETFLQSMKLSHGSEREEVLPEHIKAFYDKIPKRDLEAREYAAREIGNKDELRRIALVYKKQGNLEIAYRMMFESGAEQEDKVITKIRSKLLKEKIRSYKDKRSVTIYLDWLHENDVIGYETAFESALPLSPDGAYEEAKRRNDESRIGLARAEIVSKHKPNYSLRFFRRENDEVGYNTVIDNLAKQYDVEKDRVLELVAKKSNN